MKEQFAGAGALCLAIAASASAQVPAGPEFRINTATQGVQFVHGRSVAMAPNGDFVAIWEHSPTSGVPEVRGQRFDMNGDPLGAEFRANTSPFPGTWGGYPAMDAAGNFIVVWAGGTSDLDIRAQRFDAGGARRGAEFRVNTTTALNQYRPSIAADDAGNFVVVWHGYEAGAFSREVFGQRYDASGAPLASEFRVNTYTTGLQDSPAVAFTSNGEFVVVWKSENQDGSSYGIFGQAFHASGAPRGVEFLVNTATLGSQREPVMSADDSGRFVVAWASQQQDGSGFAINARRFDASASPLGPQWLVNTYSTGNQGRAAVAATPDGEFLVGWYSPQDGSSIGVFGQHYDSTGTPRGSEFQINTFTMGAQFYQGIAAGPDGRFVVVWTSDGQDGSASGVFGQRLSGGIEPEGLAVDSTVGSGSNGNGALEPGETVIVAPSWHNRRAVAETFDGTASGFTGPGSPGDPVYAMTDAMASYGTVPSGAVRSCTATGDCYEVGITLPSNRPLLHWDASFREDISPPLGQSKTWLLHVGRSFTDVPTSNQFYRFIETLLHHGVTGGCDATQYCPANSTTREQMAVFVLVAKEGTGYVPAACTTPMFADVPASNPFCRWIEELARRGVVGGCGGSNYCPGNPVTREQMGVFVLRTLDPTLNPPACTSPMYNDVPASNPFCRWIEELTRRGVVSGCGGGNYCPLDPVTREQMGVFLSATFGLTLYGP